MVAAGIAGQVFDRLCAIVQDRDADGLPSLRESHFQHLSVGRVIFDEEDPQHEQLVDTGWTTFVSDLEE